MAIGPFLSRHFQYVPPIRSLPYEYCKFSGLRSNFSHIHASLCIDTSENKKGSDLQDSEVERLLVERLQRGDPTAWSELYERYRGTIYAYCLRLLVNKLDAEDSVHETFLKIRNGIRRLEEPDALRLWILRIARNEAFQLLRRNQRHSNEGADFEDIWTEDTPQDELERREESEIVGQLLDRLKPEYREVLVLREYENLSYAEIARVTGASESSVKSRLFKARRALIEKYQHYFGERNES